MFRNNVKNLENKQLPKMLQRKLPNLYSRQIFLNELQLLARSKVQYLIHSMLAYYDSAAIFDKCTRRWLNLFHEASMNVF